MGGYNHKGGIFADQRQGGNPLGRWGGLKCENPAFIENGWILQGPLNCIPSFWAIKHTNVHPWTKNGRCFLEGDFGRKPLRGEIPNPMWEKRRDLSFYPRWLLQEVANKLWRGHESKPSLRARSEVAKKTHGGWIDWCFFFPWGNELPKSGTRDSFSFQPFQVRHPNSPTKPLPPNLLPGFFRFRIRVVMLRGLIGRMDPIQSSCTLCVPSKRLGIWNLNNYTPGKEVWRLAVPKRFPFPKLSFSAAKGPSSFARIFFRRNMWRI